jgi:hypothetical protein
MGKGANVLGASLGGGVVLHLMVRGVRVTCAHGEGRRAVD